MNRLITSLNSQQKIINTSLHDLEATKKRLYRFFGNKYDSNLDELIQKLEKELQTIERIEHLLAGI